MRRDAEKDGSTSPRIGGTGAGSDGLAGSWDIGLEALGLPRRSGGATTLPHPQKKNDFPVSRFAESAVSVVLGSKYRGGGRVTMPEGPPEPVSEQRKAIREFLRVLAECAK